jgi:hypothetical protein
MSGVSRVSLEHDYVDIWYHEMSTVSTCFLEVKCENHAFGHALISCRWDHSCLWNEIYVKRAQSVKVLLLFCHDRSRAKQRQVLNLCECGPEPSGSIKCKEFLGCVNN